MSHRHAAVDIDTRDAQRARLEAARDDALRRGDRSDAARHQRELDTLDAARDTETRLAKRAATIAREAQAAADHARAEQEQEAKRESIAAVQVERRRLALELDADFAGPGVLHLDKIKQCLALAREAYSLTTSRAALATEERIVEWLTTRLDLPTPWPIAKTRRRLSLAQLLGLDPLDAQPESR